MSTHPTNRRLRPRLFDFDYLILTSLRDTLRPVLAELTGTVIDFGCGDKPYRDLCPSAARYVGADLDVSDPADLKIGPDGRVPVQDDSADAVVSFQVLEHVADVPAYLSECLRLLRPGGQLVLSTHGTWVYHPMPGICDDYWRWTAAGLTRTVESFGFGPVNVRGACEGWRAMMQQALIAGGAGTIPAGRPRRLLRQCVSLAANSVTALATRSARDPSRVNGAAPTPAGRTLPICYVLRAWKN